MGPDYVEPYSDFKSRLPKLGQDKRFTKRPDPLSPTLPLADMASAYVPHNSLAPHTNVLFKMNPSKETTAVVPPIKGGNSSKSVEDDLPFSLSPRKKFPPKLGGGYELPAIRKRLAVEATRGEPVGIRGSVDISPRGPSINNSPRNAAFWSFNIPREINTGEKRCHVASIPRGKDALAAISSVQKHNKPGPSSAMPVLPPIAAIATKA